MASRRVGRRPLAARWRGYRRCRRDCRGRGCGRSRPGRRRAGAGRRRRGGRGRALDRGRARRGSGRSRGRRAGRRRGRRAAIERTTKTVARIAVPRVRKSEAPRALIMPAGLPPPASPPPSERCIRMRTMSSDRDERLDDEEEGEQAGHADFRERGVRGDLVRSARGAVQLRGGGLDDRHELRRR